MSKSVPQLLDDLAATLRARSQSDAYWFAAAPGRVNLIGDHTDYSEGFALPMAVDMYTLAVASPLDSDAADGHEQAAIRVYSEAQGEQIIPLSEPLTKANDWSDYLRGVIAGYQARGVTIPAMNLVIGGNLPLGAGLSSSASLELCIATLIEEATQTRTDIETRALLCQQAEHEYAGVPCGVLDQFAVSFAQEGTAMLLDCRTRKTTPVAVDDSLRLAIVDSGVSHALSDGGYATRRQEVHEAEGILGKSLRDSQESDLAILQSPKLRSRARHVVTENQRVHDFATALRGGNFAEAGRLMYASHRSLALDFEVSCTEMDQLVDAAKRAGALGARMTGGGFGGSMVCLVEESRQADFNAHLNAAYRDNGDTALCVRWAAPAGGARAWSTKNG